MLVLSRKKNEQIVIGDDVVLTVIEIRGDRVRLGIEAPARVPVHRYEVYQALREQALAQEQEESGSEGRPAQGSP